MMVRRCDRWLTRKLATFMGSTDSLDSANMTFGCGCRAGPTVNLQRWGGRAGGVRCSASRAHVTLRSTWPVHMTRTYLRAVWKKSIIVQCFFRTARKYYTITGPLLTSLHCALASCGAVYCNRSCRWLFVTLFIY